MDISNDWQQHGQLWIMTTATLVSVAAIIVSSLVCFLACYVVSLMCGYRGIVPAMQSTDGYAKSMLGLAAFFLLIRLIWPQTYSLQSLFGLGILAILLQLSCWVFTMPWQIKAYKQQQKEVDTHIEPIDSIQPWLAKKGGP